MPVECLEQKVKVYLESRKSWFKHSTRDHSGVYRPCLITQPPSWEGGEWTCCLLQFPLLSDFLTPCHHSLPSHLLSTQQHRAPVSDVSLTAGSPESIFSGQREVLGSGPGGSPLVAEDQERFLVLGLAGQEGKEGQRGSTELDCMALPYRGSLFGGS